MLAYVVRRLLLMIPTILGIMAVSFAIVQFVPGGPVERAIAQLQGADQSSTAAFGGGGGQIGAGASQAGQSEPNPFEVGGPEIRIDERRVVEIGSREVGPGEVRAGQVGKL